MARRSRSDRDTGTGEPYSDADAERLVQAIEAAYAAWDQAGEPSLLDVRAQVEWAGHVMPGNDGKRRTRVPIPPEQMKKVRKAVEKARKALGRKRTAKPSESRKAKGWHAQIRELVESKQGSEAADRAGLNPSRGTLVKWLSHDGGRDDFAPSKANREAISKAYEELRSWRVTEASTAAQSASKQAAEAMTEAMENEHGVNIRFRDIDEFRFE
ncbi:hypothetical protein [Streptomyces mirabilis]